MPDESWRPVLEHVDSHSLCCPDCKARVAELEAALIESNKLTYTPAQQGEIARRALESKGKGNGS